jgi:DNA-binding response OmpR family regulator
MSGKRILVVDDSDLVREVMTVALERAGYRVTTTDSFEQLLALPLAEFALILMDMDMPELFGDDVANVLRHQHNIEVPIYMLSSAPLEDLAARSREAGIDGYLSKHDGLDHVVARVREIVAGLT